MDMRELVARNFGRLRRENGLTQEEVEARSGFSQQYLRACNVVVATRLSSHCRSKPMRLL